MRVLEYDHEDVHDYEYANEYEYAGCGKPENGKLGTVPFS